jgi:ribosomal protein L1
MSQKNLSFLDYQEAVLILKNLNVSKYVESFEAIFKLKIHGKAQVLKSFLFLPYGNGKEISIGLLADKPQELLNLSSSKIKIGADDLLQEICDGVYTPNILLSTKDFSLKLSKISNYTKILAKKNLLPSINTNTIIPNSQIEIECFLDNFLKNLKIPIKIERDGTLNIVFGNTSFSTKALECNLKSIFDIVSEKKLFENNTNYYFNSLFIKTSQSPTLRINQLSFN